MKLAVMGAGAVGSAVAELATDHGHTVTALADSASAAVDLDGIDVAGALDRKAETGRVGDREPVAALAAEYDALVEATPTTLGDAQPGFGHAETALQRDRHVVLANKGPVAERYGDLMALAAESAGEVRFEATVGGAIPVLATVEDLGPERVTAIRGVLNGTANFVLSRMAAEGLGFEHVLAEAQDLGVAEADPSFDVEGTDAALKCTILANVLRDGGGRADGARVDSGRTDGDRAGGGRADGGPAAEAAPADVDENSLTLADAEVAGIREVPGGALDLAAEDGRTVRLVGEATRDGVRVGPRLVGDSGPLAVSGTRNVVQVRTRDAGRLNLSGRGAGGTETASAVLADLGRLPA